MNPDVASADDTTCWTPSESSTISTRGEAKEGPSAARRRCRSTRLAVSTNRATLITSEQGRSGDGLGAGKERPEFFRRNLASSDDFFYSQCDLAYSARYHDNLGGKTARGEPDNIGE